MHFPPNGTVVAVSAVWCCSSPPNPWNLISYVNYASNCSVKLLQNGLYSNMANLNSSSTGFCHVFLVNYNNDDTFPQTFLPVLVVWGFFLIFLHVGNMGDFLHILSTTFGLHASWCAGSWVPLQWLVKYIFNGIKTAIWSLNLNLTVTMANAKFLNNTHFWSGNPGKTFLVYTFGWGWMGGKYLC